MRRCQCDDARDDRGPRHDQGDGPAQHGQAVAELAILMPFILMMFMILIQVGLVVRDQVLVVHAARSAGRVAAVQPSVAAVAEAARSAAELDPDRLSVERGPRGRPGSVVTVTVRYRSPTIVPLIGAFVDDVVLSATASFRVEG